MSPVGLPVLCVERRELLRSYDEQILGVFFLGGAGEVVGAGDDGRAVYHHYLVVGNGVLGVDERGNAGIGEERRGGISLAPLALVEIACTLTPLLRALTKALAIGVFVKE